MLILSFFAFLSGIITILSPCILPVLPIVLTGTIGGGKARPFGIITGFVFSFTFFTLALTALVQKLGIPSDSLRIAAAVILILFGLILVIPWLRDRFEMLSSSLANIGSGKKVSDKPRTGFWSGIPVGLSLGLIWTPCVGPIMASVITLALTQKVNGGAIIITLAYAIGTAIPMLAVMLGGRKLIERVPKKSLSAIQRGFGVLTIVIGIAIWAGWDRQFQNFILTAFPNYGSGLTAIENNKIVQNALNSRNPQNTMMAAIKPGLKTGSAQVFHGATATEADLSLPDYGLAPDFIANSVWLNSPGLTMQSLRGKVVVVDFWTYSCINCIRTLPYLKAWNDAYADKGLVLIGIHTPEFEFEKKTENVRQAMKDLHVTWPVVQDNNYKMWDSYRNQYWPAHYFIDVRGHVRYYHFGEGNYAESEAVIQKLLKEAGTTVTKTVSKKDTVIEANTPETYLGDDRANAYLGKPVLTPNRTVQYSPEPELINGNWTLSGFWNVRGQFIESEKNGILEIVFNSRNVFLVINPDETGAVMKVTVDGKQSADTPDVVNGVLKPDTSRLYQLVGLNQAGRHRLRLEIKGKMRLFAFTFG